MTTTTNAFVSPQGIQTATVVTTAAKTDLTTNANATLLVAANTVVNGGLVTSLKVKPRDSAGATNLYLFRSPDGGANLQFIAEANCPAFTKSTTVVGPTVDFGYTPANPLSVGANQSLYVAQSVFMANGFCWDTQYQNL